MKKIKLFLLTAICIAMASSSAFAQTTKDEENASNAVAKYLKTLGYNAQIDTRDYSVNFYAKDTEKTFFWITFKEDKKSIIYTLHRRPIKMQTDQDTEEEVQRKLKYAVSASDIMNQLFPFKTYVIENRVEFVFDNYSTSPDEYVKVFPAIFKTMQNIGKDFKTYYDQVKAENPVNEIVVPQDKNSFGNANQGTMLDVTDIEFRVVDKNKNMISDYNKGIRKQTVNYIQPRLTVKTIDKGTYTIGYVIYDQNGKKLVPSTGDERSAITTVDITKKQKNPSQIELDIFGSSDGKIWKPGEYRVEFFENNVKIGEATFDVI